MKIGDHVRISSVRGTVLGTVADLKAPGELPPVPGMDIAVVRTILEEWHVAHAGVFKYPWGDGETDVMFVAFCINGEWFDLRRQRLTIEVVQVA